MRSVNIPVAGQWVSVQIARHDGSGWVVFAGALPSLPTAHPQPPTGPARNIATRCSAANVGSAAASIDGAGAVTRHMFSVDATEVTLAWDVTNGFRQPTVGGLYRAAINDGSGWQAVTVAGSESWHIDATQKDSLRTITSDPITLKAFAGDTIEVYSWVEADGSGAAPASISGAVPGDRAHSGPYAPTAAVRTPPGGFAMRPSRIVAPSDRPAWIIGGDSIFQQNWSFGAQAIDARGHAFVESAQGGEGFNSDSRWSYRYGPHVPYATHWLDELGINEVTNDWNFVTTNAIKHWKWVKDHGIQTLIKTTLTLSVSTSDNWRTLEGQTPARTPGRENFNAWLRDGAPIIDGAAVAVGTPGATRCDVVTPDGSIIKGTGGHYIDAVSDVVAAVESSENSGRYSLAAGRLMAGHSDGLHPNGAIHQVLGERLARDLQLLGF